MSKKYLSKNEFRYNTNPNVKRDDGEFHVAFVLYLSFFLHRVEKTVKVLVFAYVMW